jgi:hypothetical protein
MSTARGARGARVLKFTTCSSIGLLTLAYLSGTCSTSSIMDRLIHDMSIVIEETA